MTTTTNLFEDVLKAFTSPASEKHDPATCWFCKSLTGSVSKAAANAKFADEPPTNAEAPKPKSLFAELSEGARKLREEANVKRAREREALTRAFAIVENQIRSLPGTTEGLAGWLYAKNMRGDVSGAGNAFALYLTSTARGVDEYDKAIFSHIQKITVYVQDDAIMVESPTFQLVAAPPAHVTRLVRGIREGMYPNLVK